MNKITINMNKLSIKITLLPISSGTNKIKTKTLYVIHQSLTQQKVFTSPFEVTIRKY